MSPQTVSKRVQIIAKDEDRQVITGPVLVPDREDRHGDVVRESNITDVAYKFMEEYQNVDLMHTFQDVGVPVESYTAPEELDFDGTEVPKGSWIISVKVTEPEVWQAVKTGELTGFSIYGQGERKPLDDVEEDGSGQSQSDPAADPGRDSPGGQING